MAFVLQMNAGPALSENSLGSLKLRSSATVYLAVEWKAFLSLLLLLSISCLSQNKQILYNFTAVPQSLLANQSRF
jgi:hypothetical protein